MRKVEIRAFKAQEGEVQENVPTYANMILGAVRAPKNPQAGANYDEMLRTIPIMKKIEHYIENGNDHDGHILLEEKDFEYLCDRMKTASFGFNNEELMEMIQSILDAEEVHVELTDKKKAKKG